MYNTSKGLSPHATTELPEEFINKFNHFQNWLLDLEKLLNEKKSDLYLNDNISSWKEEYYNMTSSLGDICFRQSIEVKEAIRQYVAGSKSYSLHLEAPYYRQIIVKPRGYAGDADMMNIIYRNEFEGESMMGKVLHKIATECRACEAVRNRKNLMQQFIREKQGSVLSLAAGPATEILELLKTEVVSNFSFTALDHDIETILDVKKQDLNNEINYGVVNAFRLLKGNKTVLFPRRKLKFKFDPQSDTKGLRKILLPVKYKVRKLKGQHFDLIYSAGLYDYIETFESNQKGTKALTKELFDLLKPGGILIIGNFANETPMEAKWVMEFICNWFLIYRDESEILNFTSSIPQEAIDSIEIVKEATGINYFLRVVKKTNPVVSI